MTTTELLINQLTHIDGTQRRHAALALGTAGDRAAVPALVERLAAEEQSCVREDITWAVVQMIDEARPQVQAMLTSENPDDRRTGAHVLSKVGHPDDLAQLAPLVGDEHSDVAIKAYRAVANTGRPEAADALATRLGDGDYLQRDALVAAFKKVGQAGVPALIAALSHADVAVREHAADALGHLGSPDADQAAEALASAANDSDVTVRTTAVSALGQLGEVADGPLRTIAAGPDAMLAAIASRLLEQRAKADAQEQLRARIKAIRG